jgi:hypothetical protein
VDKDLEGQQLLAVVVAGIDQGRIVQRMHRYRLAWIDPSCLLLLSGLELVQHLNQQ